MKKDRDFPIMHGGAAPGRQEATGPRARPQTVCTPGTNLVMNGQLDTRHCINSSSRRSTATSGCARSSGSMAERSSTAVNSETVLPLRSRRSAAAPWPTTIPRSEKDGEI